MIAMILFFITYFLGAPWTPTEKNVVRKMLKMAGASSKTRVYDLGSGDGRIVIMAAKEFGASGVGVEINPLLFLLSVLYSVAGGMRKRTRFILNSFFKVNLRDADIVTLFLLQPTNINLKDKLERELRHGTKVVSYKFTFPGWKLKKKDLKDKIYLYVR
jgi:SAM-dependent methyltransferase